MVERPNRGRSKRSGNPPKRPNRSNRSNRPRQGARSGGAPADPVRGAALQLLVDFDAAPFPLTGRLDQRQTSFREEVDRGLLRSLVLETLRHRSRIDHLLGMLLHQGAVDSLPIPIRNILRLGAVQAVRMERIPAHAIVDSSVRLAKGYGHRGTAGLVNAVLRKVVERGPELWTGQESESLSLRYSHPDWLVDRWVSRWGNERVERILRWNSEAPDYWLRLAPGCELPEGAVAGWIPGTGRMSAGSNPAAHPEFRSGGFSIQDGSGILVGNLIPEISGTVLDSCAAPGTKTGHLLERAAPGASIVALDQSVGRLRRLRRGLGRLALAEEGQVEIVAADSRNLPFASGWDGLLLDAPCSNLGVIRRRIDLKWRITEPEIASLAELQRELLREAARGLKPGGWLVYSVCTIEPEETTAQRSWFLEEHDGWEPIQVPAFVPAGATGEIGELAILPGEFETDGGYAFAFRKH